VTPDHVGPKKTGLTEASYNNPANTLVDQFDTDAYKIRPD